MQKKAGEDDENMVACHMQKVRDTNWCGQIKGHFLSPWWLKNDEVLKRTESQSIKEKKTEQ